VITHADHQTALHVACNLGHTGIVKAFLRKGARVDVINADGKTPLYLAFKRSYTKIINSL
jgi:ankyrin repeat protein